MNAAVGPLSTAPSTIGETATTGAAASRSAAAMPGTARIGRIEMIGLLGPMTIASAAAIASRTAAGTVAASMPRVLDAVDGPGGPLADHERLEVVPRAAGEHARADRLVAHRQHARADAEAGGQLGRAPR